MYPKPLPKPADEPAMTACKIDLGHSIDQTVFVDVVASAEALTNLVQPVETLRDKYAMAALTGLLACPNILGTLEELSARSFEYADECIKQRKERNE